MHYDNIIFLNFLNDIFVHDVSEDSFRHQFAKVGNCYNKFKKNSCIDLSILYEDCVVTKN